MKALVGRQASELWVCQLGTVPYRAASEMQQRLARLRQQGELPDVLLLLEHPPVLTRGRRSAAGELLRSEEHCRERGVEVIDTDRGGRITYHGPGQLVGYPIMQVHDVIGHLRTMEAAIVAALAEERVSARARPEDGPDYTGVWVGERKIASIGVHVSRGVSTHGFAVNVENDLEPFSWVIACGLAGVAMTSLEAETGRGAPLGCFRRRIAHGFCSAHARRQRIVFPRRLGIDAPAASARGAPVLAA